MTEVLQAASYLALLYDRLANLDADAIVHRDALQAIEAEQSGIRWALDRARLAFGESQPFAGPPPAASPRPPRKARRTKAQIAADNEAARAKTVTAATDAGFARSDQLVDDAVTRAEAFLKREPATEAAE